MNFEYAIFTSCTLRSHGVLQISIFPAQFYQNHIRANRLLSNQDNEDKLSVPRKMYRTLGIGPKSKKEYAVYLDERNKIQILIEFL